MIPPDVVGLFLGASIALALAPGPDNLFVLTQAALQGRWAGIAVTLGLCSGILVHTSAVALGVAALLEASATAFTIVKTIGAVYLLYLAWLAFRAGAADPSRTPRAPTKKSALYARGVVMNVTNPKVAIFFLAFLPQFASPERGSMTLQLLVLGGLFMSATLVVFSSIAWAAGLIGGWLRRSTRAQVVMHRIAGTVFVALAVHLLASKR